MKNDKTHPEPVEAALYDEAYYRDFNRGFEAFAGGQAWHPVFDQALQVAAPSRGDVVLDIGCGRGELVALCARRGCRAFGIDYSEQAVQIAQKFLLQTFPPPESPAMKVEVMNAKALSYPDNFFDLVLMLDIVEHLHDGELRQVYREVRRVLKPGGRLLVHTNPNAWCMKPVRLLASLAGMELKSAPFHVNEQSVFSLRKGLSGFFSVDRLFLRHDRRFWYNGTIGRGKAVRTAARLVDFCLDNPLSRLLVRHTWLKYPFMSDIWLLARKPAPSTAL